MAARKKRKITKAKKKTPVKTPGAELVTQLHGGALKTGGNPGNKGGTGRPKSEVRAAALAGADKAIPKLIAIVEDAKSEKSEITAAGKVLLQFGLGTQTEVSVEDIKHRLTRQMEVLREEIPLAILERVVARLHPIWTGST